MSWVAVTGCVTARGPEAVLLRKGAVVGVVSMAYAGEIVKALNDALAPGGQGPQAIRMHQVVVELYAMLSQAIESRERDAFTTKESDDAKRARQLLERAGRIAQGVEQ